MIDLATNKRINHSEDIVIGAHVWIGARATVLKGVKISDHVIVGNRLIVTKSCIKSNCIISDASARMIKENIGWTREQI